MKERGGESDDSEFLRHDRAVRSEMTPHVSIERNTGFVALSTEDNAIPK